LPATKPRSDTSAGASTPHSGPQSESAAAIEIVDRRAPDMGNPSLIDANEDQTSPSPGGTAAIGVGFLGAGPATQAIHVPTLATFGARFRVVKVMDFEESVARAVARRSGATATTSATDVLNDPAVEVVAVNSANAFHVGQVVAACAAGKRAILCEKPLAETVEDARTVAQASAASGVPVVVGTMHAHDPAVVAALDGWAEIGERATLVRSSIYLPENALFINAATDLASPPSQRAHHPPAGTVRHAILTLAIHAIPIVRRLFPEFDRVSLGRTLGQLGYLVTLHDGPRTAQLIGVVPTHWKPDWTLRAISPHHQLEITFPPSYVLAGSATAELSGPDGTKRWSFQQNGYQAEWAEIATIVRDGTHPRYAINEAVEDLEYALRLIEASGEQR
jgi:myo-inositol 2-dehydrogenase / D-chiro-inositol 1-dehydrogenase